MKTGAGKSTTGFPIFLLVSVLVLLVMYLGYNIFTLFQDGEKDRVGMQLTSDMRALSYRLSGLAREASNGTAPAFAELDQVVTQMQVNWDRLRNNYGDELDTAQLERFNAVWKGVEGNAQTITTNRDTVLSLNQSAHALNESLPGLQNEYGQLVETLLSRRAPAEQVAVAQAQSWRAERIARNVDKMLSGGGDAEATANQFDRDVQLFGRVQQGMKQGDAGLGISRVTERDAQAGLGRVTEQFTAVKNSATRIFAATPALFNARKASDAITVDTPVLLEEGARLSNIIGGLSSGAKRRFANNQTAIWAGVALLAVFAALALVFFLSTRQRLRETAATNSSSQEAILRLLDEIEGLGEGDLTAEVTVTEDFTGAIADAINYAIVQLRELVSRIGDTAENVHSSANETRGIALQLSESSEHQAQEIAGASAAINEMAITIDQVSANAAESAAVAERSVSIAKKGADVVRNTIKGMDNIREQIQDTSKRIKRLGESSQEIGDIVSLINDIADQTNILALNAAIQASMAGDAGRGFAVVADEVQRLAERSANATKQIAALVKTIQTDTNEAVSSMEQTTAEVVAGASLTQDAGVALGEIESVSTNLAELIQDISTAARHQSTTAGHISNTMNVIQDITSQTLAGTNNTATSIGELAEVAVELRESVSGFKLPDAGPRGLLKVAAAKAVHRAPPAATIATPPKPSKRERPSPVSAGPLAMLGDVDEFDAYEGPQDISMGSMDAMSAKPVQHNYASTLEQSRATLSAMDDQADSAFAGFGDDDAPILDDDLVLGDDLGTEDTVPNYASELENELAGIDLDEFDLDLDDQSSTRHG